PDSAGRLDARVDTHDMTRWRYEAGRRWARTERIEDLDPRPIQRAIRFLALAFLAVPGGRARRDAPLRNRADIEAIAATLTVGNSGVGDLRIGALARDQLYVGCVERVEARFLGGVSDEIGDHRHAVLAVCQTDWTRSHWNVCSRTRCTQI